MRGISNLRKMAMVMAIFLYSCTDSGKMNPNTFTLVNHVPVNEDSNTIHYAPPFVQVISDSLVSFGTSPMHIGLYNIYTGQEEKSIHLDTLLMPQLLKLNRTNLSIVPRMYKINTTIEYNKIGLSPFELHCLIPSIRKDSIYLFFSMPISFDTVYLHDGKIIPNETFMKVSFLAIYNSCIDTLYDFRNIDEHTEMPLFPHGIFVTNDNKMYIKNMGALNNNATEFDQHGMLCTLTLDSEKCKAHNVNLPYSTRAKADLLAHHSPRMSYSPIAGTDDFLVSDGFRVLRSTGELFKDLEITLGNEEIQTMQYNAAKELLYVHTLEVTNKYAASKIYCIDMKTKKAALLDARKEQRSIVFLNENTFLSIAENQQSKRYEFSIYQVNSIQ